MDNETKNILKILGVAIVVLFIFKPKVNGKSKSSLSKNLSKKDSVKPPKTDNGNSNDDEFDNAVLSIKAYRNAINENEPQSELDKLNRITLDEYGIKVFNMNGKLYARNTKGQNIANEK